MYVISTFNSVFNGRGRKRDGVSDFIAIVIAVGVMLDFVAIEKLKAKRIADIYQSGHRFPFRGLSEVLLVQSQIDILRKAIDEMMAFRKRGAPFENQPRDPFDGFGEEESHEIVFLNKRRVEAPPFACGVDRFFEISSILMQNHREIRSLLVSC